MSLIVGLGTSPVHAEGLKSAQVSRIYNDVKLLPENQAPRAAAVSDTISGKSAVQTGTGSRTELMFTDKTLTRLGANSYFSFVNGTRDMNLGSGTMLLQVPKGAGGAEIHTAAVTAAITGTTLMVEFNPKSYSKIVVLEGTVRVFLTKRIGESVLVHAGQMVIVPPGSASMPEPVGIDLKVLYATSGLINDFGPLASRGLIDREVNKQKKDIDNGRLVDTNLFIVGQGTEVQEGHLSFISGTDHNITARQTGHLPVALGESTARPVPPPAHAVPHSDTHGHPQSHDRPDRDADAARHAHADVAYPDTRVADAHARVPHPDAGQPHAVANGGSDRDASAHGHTYTYTDTYSHPDADPDSHADSQPHGFAQSRRRVRPRTGRCRSSPTIPAPAAPRPTPSTAPARSALIRSSRPRASPTKAASIAAARSLIRPARVQPTACRVSISSGRRTALRPSTRRSASTRSSARSATWAASSSACSRSPLIRRRSPRRTVPPASSSWRPATSRILRTTAREPPALSTCAGCRTSPSSRRTARSPSATACRSPILARQPPH